MTEPQDLRPVASFTDERGEERWVAVNSSTGTQAWVEHTDGTTEVVPLHRLHHESGPPIRPAATFTHEITQQMGEPAEAKIFRNGVLVFSGIDRSALTKVSACPHVVTSEEGTSYCTLAESGARAAAEEREMGFTETLHHLGVEGLLQRSPHRYDDLVKALRVQSPSDSLSHRAADAIEALTVPLPTVGDTVSFRWGSGRQEGTVDSPPSVHVNVGNGYGMTVPVTECSIYRDASVPGSGQTASPSTGDQP